MENLEKSVNIYDEKLYEEMKTADMVLENMKTLAVIGAETYGFSGDKILNDVKILSEEKIQNFEIADICNFLKDNGYPEDVLVKSHMDSADHTIPYIDYARGALLEIRELALEVESSQLDKIKLCKEIANAKSEQEKRLRSPEYKEHRARALAQLEEAVNTAENSTEKRRALEKLNTIKNSDTLDFLFDRFNKFSDKEIKSIVDGFLDEKKFEYIWKKYSNNVKYLNISPGTIKRFYHIEEMFLHESYHPFNNLFLFIVIRFIAYMNPHNNRDMLYANALIVKCDHLVYHRFDSLEDEESFKTTIKTILNMFMSDEYIALFEQKNTSSPTHPMRIAIDEAKRKQTFDLYMNTLKFELDGGDAMEYLSNDTSVENMKSKLDDMYQEKMKMVDELSSNHNCVVSVNTPYTTLLNTYNEHVHPISTESTDIDESDGVEVLEVDIDDPDLLFNENGDHHMCP